MRPNRGIRAMACPDGISPMRKMDPSGTAAVKVREHGPVVTVERCMMAYVGNRIVGDGSWGGHE